MPPDQSRWTQDSKDAHLAASAARFYNYATTDIHTCITLPAALDETMPGTLEKKTLLSMSRLWTREAWTQHRSVWRWYSIIVKWPQSSILAATAGPLLTLILWTLLVQLLNHVVFPLLWELCGPSESSWLRPGLFLPAWTGSVPSSRLTSLFGLTAPFKLSLPMALLSLQAGTIGLLVVFRNNQTHDRLKEAQRSLGGLGALGREIMQILVANTDPAASRDVAHAARLLALFGWALKCEQRAEDEAFLTLARTLNPRSHGWILERPHWAASVLLRLRAAVGALRKDGKLPSDAFKFVEEKLAKLSAVDATCTRLATFPVPPSYHRHGSRAILLNLGALPMVLEGQGVPIPAALVTVVAAGFVLLGVDQISMEVEQPLDVLPLQAFARGMSLQVLRVLESWATMPRLPRLEDDDSDLGQASPALRPAVSAPVVPSMEGKKAV